MTFQFKVRPKQSPHQQCEKEMTLLRDYNRALEKENQSKNEQRKALLAEIDRLSRLEREWKEKAGLNKSQFVGIAVDSKEYTTLKEQFTDLKSKYEALLIENSTLTSRIITSDYNTTRVTTFENQRSKLTQTIRNYETKIIALQTQLQACEKELIEAKNRQESTSTTITRQYQDSLTNIEQLQRQLRAKSEQIGRLQFQASAKEEQNKALQRSVDGYSLKIDALSEELSRLERAHKVETVRLIQRQDPILRSKFDQLASLNAALTADNVALHGQAEYTRELERRTALLEESNRQLQIELKAAVEARGSASRVQLQEDRNLKQAVYSLKAELQEVRSFNQLVRQQNEQLYTQLQQLKSHSQGHSRCQKCKHHHHKSRSRSPIRQEEKMRLAIGETYSALQTNLTQQTRNHSNQYNTGSQSQAHFHTFQQSKSRLGNQSNTLAPPSQAVNQRYNDLQRKIQMLQNENQVLKQHLVHQI